jgi:hypothetical protein
VSGPARYSNRQGPARAPRGPSHDTEIPTPGCYAIRRENFPSRAVRIWLGHPIDPDTGEEMTERGFRWQASIDGQPVPLDSVWPACARHPIDHEEHERICERNATMDANSPFYDARKPIDKLAAPPPF